MPLIKPTFAPSVNKDDSPLAAEGSFIDSDKIRFVNGKWQVQGGYEQLSASTFTGIARGAHAWKALGGSSYLAWGTNSKLYALIGTTITDITPPQGQGILIDPFLTISGSATVVVAHLRHNVSVGMSVTFSNVQVTVGGLNMNGAWSVSAVYSPLIFAFTHTSNATSSVSNAGGIIDFSYALPTSVTDGTSSTAVRTWALDNFGENLVASPRGYGLYMWQPEQSYPEIIQNGNMSSSAGWTLGANWTIGAGAASKTAGAANDLIQIMATSTPLEPGRYYRLQATITRTSASGGLSIKIAGAVVSPLSSALNGGGTYNVSRCFRCPPIATSLDFVADASWAGTVDNVSLKLERQLVALGCDEEGSPYVYNALLVRWCDQEDIQSWTPSASNLAGSYPLAKGGRIT
jgi:hypothetical protein